MSNNKVVAIHQPNFFPWLGYFNKIARAGTFIVMDNAQFPKKGGTWTNRVRLMVGGQPAWVTMPVVRAYHGVRRIEEMRIDESTPWRAKLLKTIETNYRPAPHFAEVFPFISELANNPTDDVTKYNVSAIAALCDALKLDASGLVLGSQLKAEGAATDLLISMVEAVSGTAYLCGGGADGYQEDEKFAERGLRLIYQSFNHPVYQQSGASDFTPGLSIIDALMNCGFERTRQLVCTAEV
ncbi:MAG TPA: WbqC family protein [Pyrinomonadaceae bacterium]|jgi:hypothetical protein